jgi:UDP-glucose 4-epimerase
MKRGFEVLVADDLSRGHRSAVPANLLHVVRLQDAAALTKLLENVDAVVHFAAYIAVGESTREPELYFANNVGGSLSLFEAMARAHVKRLVFSSTAAVYGEPPESPIPEDSPFAPVSPYGQSKAMVDGTCLRDYIHVGDLASAHLAALDHLLAGGESAQFNVGTGEGRTVLEVLRAVEEVSGRKVPYKIAPRRDGDSPSLVANSQKLQQALGWKPLRSDLHQIVRDAWNFFIKEQS